MLCACARVRVTQLRQLLVVTGCVTPMRSWLGISKARKEEKKQGKTKKIQRGKKGRKGNKKKKEGGD